MSKPKRKFTGLLLMQCEHFLQRNYANYKCHSNSCHRDSIKGLSHDKPLCKWDDETSPFRFYNIEVMATDYAGNVGQATVTVIILEQGYKDDLRRFGSAFDSTSFFIDFARLTPPQYVISTKELLWDTSKPSTGLSTVTPPASTTTAQTQTKTIVSLPSTLVVAGLAPADTPEDLASMVNSLEESTTQLVSADLSTNQEAYVNVTAIGGQVVRHRRLLAGTSVEFTVTIIDICTAENCADDIGSVIGEKVSNEITSAVKSEAFTTILQEVSTKNGVESLQEVSVVGANVSEDVTTIAELQLNVVLSSSVAIGGMDMTSLGNDAVATLIGALTETLQNICAAITSESCAVKIVSPHGNRFLQELPSSVVFGYDVNIQVDCTSTDCADIEAVAESLDGAVIAAVDNAVQSGSLISSIQQLLPKSPISQMLGNAVIATNPSDTISASFANGYYPDFEGKSMTCLKGLPPTYMQRDGEKFLHASIAECCKEHFNKYYHVCTGSTVGFYPNWSGENGIKCSNNNETIPMFIKQASGTYQHETIEECCEHFYRVSIQYELPHQWPPFPIMLTVIYWHLSYHSGILTIALLEVEGSWLTWLRMNGE